MLTKSPFQDAVAGTNCYMTLPDNRVQGANSFGIMLMFVCILYWSGQAPVNQTWLLAFNLTSIT